MTSKPIDYQAELMLEVADLRAAFPDVPLPELALGLERRADAFADGPDCARSIAVELRRQAEAATKPKMI